MRTKAQIHCLSGHTNTVAQVRCQAAEPQVRLQQFVSTLKLSLVVAAGKIRTENYKLWLTSGEAL